MNTLKSAKEKQVDQTEDGQANDHRNGVRQKIAYTLLLLLLMMMKMKERMCSVSNLASYQWYQVQTRYNRPRLFVIFHNPSRQMRQNWPRSLPATFSLIQYSPFTINKTYRYTCWA